MGLQLGAFHAVMRKQTSKQANKNKIQQITNKHAVLASVVHERCGFSPKLFGFITKLLLSQVKAVFVAEFFDNSLRFFARSRLVLLSLQEMAFALELFGAFIRPAVSLPAKLAAASWRLVWLSDIDLKPAVRC